MKTMTRVASLAAFTAMAMAPLAPAVAGPDGQVRIGVLTDMSGPYADSAGRGSAVMAEMAVADFGGQVLGKPGSIVSADHQNKPDVGASVARQWLDVDKVDAIFDLPNSAVLLAVQEVVRNNSGLLFSSGGGSSAFTGKACSTYGFQ